MATEVSLSSVDAPDTEAAQSAATKGDALIAEFVVQNPEHYIKAFNKIGATQGYVFTFNLWAAILGPLWAGARSLWGLFWLFALAELFAIVQLGRGLWGDLGADKMAQAEKLMTRAAERQEAAIEAIKNAATNAEALQKSAETLGRAAENAMLAAEAAVAQGPKLTMIGLVLLVLVKAIQGMTADWALERRFVHWRADRSLKAGISQGGFIGAALLAYIAIYPMTIYRFTVAKPAQFFTDFFAVFPSNRDFRVSVATELDKGFDFVTINGEALFDSIVFAIRILLDGLEVMLVSTPWPVVMAVIVVLAWRLAGPRVAIFTVAALAYLAFLGFWEKSMATVALLGAAAFICIAIGIPIGIWCAKSKSAFAVVRPILDFMQTMPAFVYLIPVIAFFGTGKPPGILATLIFGMPPVIRLTVLGLRGVPPHVREAAMAFGANKRFLLFKVDLPLALPSIMTGINQTILMCLSMVVIASLIGAKGLGEDVLEALQYAAEGQGMLAGFAILFCAMILDRIVQGRSGPA